MYVFPAKKRHVCTVSSIVIPFGSIPSSALGGAGRHVGNKCRKKRLLSMGTGQPTSPSDSFKKKKRARVTWSSQRPRDATCEHGVYHPCVAYTCSTSATLQLSDDPRS